jgi:hypothetical protein
MQNRIESTLPTCYNNFYFNKIKWIRSATLQIVSFFFFKPTAEPRTYIAGKPTSNVGSRFRQTDKYSRFFSN